LYDGESNSLKGRIFRTEEPNFINPGRSEIKGRKPDKIGLSYYLEPDLSIGSKRAYGNLPRYSCGAEFIVVVQWPP
jgi:hypothetical protein